MTTKPLHTTGQLIQYHLDLLAKTQSSDDLLTCVESLLAESGKLHLLFMKTQRKATFASVALLTFVKAFTQALDPKSLPFEPTKARITLLLKQVQEQSQALHEPTQH